MARTPCVWCPACRSDIGRIEELYRQNEDRDFKLISISLDVDLDRLKEYVRKQKLTFPVLFDGKGWKNEISQAYGVTTTPTYFLVDPEGMIEGHVSWSRELEKDLEVLR